MAQNFREGNFFSVALGHGGFGIGLLARQPRRGTVVLAYFFGPRRTLNNLTEGLSALKPSDAQMVCRLKDTGLHRGLWRVVAVSPDWDRQQWPVPPFLRKEGLSGKSIRVEYDGDNLMVPSRETVAGVTDAALPDDMVFDEERMVEALDKLLVEHKSSGAIDPSQWTG